MWPDSWGSLVNSSICYKLLAWDMKHPHSHGMYTYWITAHTKKTCEEILCDKIITKCFSCVTKVQRLNSYKQPILHRGNKGNCLHAPWSFALVPLKCSSRNLQFPLLMRQYLGAFALSKAKHTVLEQSSTRHATLKTCLIENVKLWTLLNFI